MQGPASTAQALQAVKSKKEVLLAAKLHVVEKLVRKQHLYVPSAGLASSEGAEQGSGTVDSEKKALRLATYIWNCVKSDWSRHAHRMAGCVTDVHGSCRYISKCSTTSAACDMMRHRIA